MPWGFVVMVAVFGTLELLLRGLNELHPGRFVTVRRFLWAGAVLALGVFLIYLVFQERWLWY